MPTSVLVFQKVLPALTGMGMWCHKQKVLLTGTSGPTIKLLIDQSKRSTKASEFFTFRFAAPPPRNQPYQQDEPSAGLCFLNERRRAVSKTE